MMVPDPRGGSNQIEAISKHLEAFDKEGIDGDGAFADEAEIDALFDALADWNHVLENLPADTPDPSEPQP